MERNANSLDNVRQIIQVSLDAWSEFKKNESKKLSASTLLFVEASLPSLILELWSKEFAQLVDGIRTNSIPANRIYVYFRVTGESLSETEEAKRIRLLLEALEKNRTIASVILPMADRHTIFTGYEQNVIPFFQFFSGPHCRIESLEIHIANKNLSVQLLTMAFEGNTSLKRLKIRSNSPKTWSALSALKTQLEALSLDTLLEHRPYPSKKGIEAVISTLKRSRSLTEFELKYRQWQKPHDVTMGRDYIAILTQLSKMTTLKSINLRLEHEKLKLDHIAAILQSNINLETVILYSDAHSNPKLMHKALATLSQNAIKKISLNIGIESISALEGNATITDLEIRNTLVYSPDVISTLASMKSLTSLSLANFDLYSEYRIREMGPPSKQDMEYQERWAMTYPVQQRPRDAIDLTPLIGPNSPLNTLKICQYAYIPSESFLKTLKINTSLIRLELLAADQDFDIEFIKVLEMNPFIDIKWTSTQPVIPFKIMSVIETNNEKLAYIRNAVTILQTILLAKDRGLFSNVPIEVMFNIFQYFTRGLFTDKQLAVLVNTASLREWIFSNRDIKDKLRYLWRNLLACLNENK